jgi:hypothetical protein
VAEVLGSIHGVSNQSVPDRGTDFGVSYHSGVSDGRGGKRWQVMIMAAVKILSHLLRNCDELIRVLS